MYQVIAKFHKFKGQYVQPIYYAKQYKTLKGAEKFLESQKNHSKFYFEILPVETNAAPVSFPKEC